MQLGDFRAMKRLIPALVLIAFAAAFWYFIMLPIGDVMNCDKFAKETQAYLDVAERKIVVHTLAWASCGDRLRKHDREDLTERFDAFKPLPHSKLYRGGGDWVVLHYEILQAMRNHARDKAERDLCIDRERIDAETEQAYLPEDWLRREQLFEGHFRISRHWDRPSKPLAHLKSEYEDLKKQLEKFMEDLGVP